MMTTGELMMDVGTVLDGEAAVQEGLIDRLGGLGEAIECLYEMIEARAKEQPTEPEKPKKTQKSGRKKGGKA